MRYVSNRGKVEENIGAEVKVMLVAKAVEYERILDGLFTEPKSGRMYGNAAALKRFARRTAKGKPGKVSGVHRASAPGEAPAIWTAALRKSVRHVITRIDGMNYSVQIGVASESGRAEIAKFLEFGTTRMAPRPAWRTALAMLSQRFAERRA